ncbi:hypothetical protein DL96DRAFT_1704252 [Flagelloscypha sp. PMI_526]|nr:hypothetical protein DL96DRAFT_1704252 [Flagelloscypha sp. PMI_526]
MSAKASSNQTALSQFIKELNLRIKTATLVTMSADFSFEDKKDATNTLMDFLRHNVSSFGKEIRDDKEALNLAFKVRELFKGGFPDIPKDQDLPENYQVVYKTLYKPVFDAQAKEAKEKEEKKRKIADLKQKRKRKVFTSPEFVPDHWLAEEDSSAKASNQDPSVKLSGPKKSRKDLGTAGVEEFDVATQNAIAKRGRIAVANNLEHGAPTLETLRAVEAEAKAEVANLTFRISHYLFLRDQAIKALQRSTDCLSHAEKAMAFVVSDTEAMSLDE